MILREAPMKELIARRDELRSQAAAIDAEIARRAREAMELQCRERQEWARQNSARTLETCLQR